jgi:lipoate-protein ligase A
MTTWRLLATGARPGRWNMACDAALLAVAATPTLRLYAWDPPAVSLGHHQPAPGATEFARLTSLGLDWVRRPTGGRAVAHGGPDEELTYAVVAPIGDAGFPGGLADAYRRIHEAIAAGLGTLGAGVECVRRPEGPGPVSPSRRLACFAASARWEITAGGRKLVGSAQRRSRRALLQHGSIPLAGDQDVLEAVWPGSLPGESSTTLSAATGRIVGFDETARALTAAFERTLDVRLEPGPLTRDEKERLRELLPAASFA